MSFFKLSIDEIIFLKTLSQRIEDFSGEKITLLSADFNSNIKLYAYWKSGFTVPGGVASLNSFLASLSDVETNTIII